LNSPRLGKGFVQPVPGKQGKPIGKTEEDIHFVGPHRFNQGADLGKGGGTCGGGKGTRGAEPGGVFGKNVVDPLTLVILQTPVFVLGDQREDRGMTFVKGVYRPASFGGPSVVGSHRFLRKNGEAP
jgi:hypothetical protein